MKSSIKNFILGLFVLVAIALAVSTLLFLKPTVGDGKQTLYVRFSDLNKIGVGTRVVFAGKPVGEVVAIHEIKDARLEPTDELGRVYFYELTLKIDSSTKVYNTDEISIQTSGLLGEKAIAIVPKAPPLGVIPRRITTQPVYADSVDTFQNALVEFSELSGSMEEAFKEFSKWLHLHGEELANSIQSVGSASFELKKTVASIDTVIDELQRNNAFGNLGLGIENFAQITQDISKGKGTIGKLIANPDMYLNANALFTKANTLMNDMNQYGILFHLNKRWQRLNLQRLNLQTALNSPQAFRNYFEAEVSAINTAMGHLSHLIAETETNFDHKNLSETEDFKNQFYQLLCEAEQLSANLRLYNEQLLNNKLTKRD